ncbi:hypothetical protein E4T56_gene6799 [Termitomyces sp. T112]|nr:hypothetical protein E4T56_gene6799 [Termitomyces sp. T112]
MGAFAPSVLVSAWYSNNTPSEARRAVVAAVMVALANSSGLISTNIFRARRRTAIYPSLKYICCIWQVLLHLSASVGVYMR